MTIYVAFVAVLNLLLGAYLAKFNNPSSVRRKSTVEPVTASPICDRQNGSPPAATEDTAMTPAAAAPADNTGVANATDDDVGVPKKSPPANAKTWDDFVQQLRDVRSRTRYCRPAQDMRLVRQAAEQLKACAIVWYSQFEKFLLGEELDEETRRLVAGTDMGAIEMFAAQIETTITNLGALDFTAPVDEVLNLIEKELELLNDQQKLAASNKRQLTPA